MTSILSTRLVGSCRAFLALLTLGTCLIALPGRSQEIIINEILAGNTNVAPLLDYPDYYPDYIELYNASVRDIDLGAEGWSITDDIRDTNKFRFPVGLIFPADSYLLLYCDNQDPTNFPGLLPANNLHTGFNLNAKGGELLAIFKTGGRVLITSNAFGIQVSGFSVGRVPGANVGAPFTLTYPTPCGGTIPCDNNIPFTNFGSQFKLRINEWLQTNYMADDWLEIFNPDTNIVDLGGLVLTDDKVVYTNPPPPNLPIRAVPPLSYIGPQSYVRFWCDDLHNRDADHLGFSLSSGSSRPPMNGILDQIYLVDRDRATIIDHVYCTLFQQRNVSEGRVPDGEDRIIPFINPSPEDSNFGAIPELTVNEVLPHTDLPLEDAVEIQNVTNVPVDISYWWLSNQKFVPKKYQIPAGTIIPPGGFKVIYQYEWNAAGSGFTFNSAHGDECYLFKAGPDGVLTGFRKGVQFGPAANGVSFGRYVTSDTNVEFVAMSDLSVGTNGVRAGQDPSLIDVFRTGRGVTNPLPLVGPIVINEIHFRPRDTYNDLGVALDDSLHEFVELRNITQTNVALFWNLFSPDHTDVNFLTNGWKVRGAIKYDFDNGFSPHPPFLRPNEFALLVNFDPTNDLAFTDAWRRSFTPPVPDDTQLFGPYKGKLSNGGGSIELYRPDAPQTDPHPDAGFVPYILVERVKYSDHSPWPTNDASGTLLIDGGGASLQRRYSYEFGNDPTNWFGDVPTPGYYNSPSHLEKPYLLSQPQDYNGSPSVLVTFNAPARGDTPISHQWYRNGVPLVGANSASLSVTAGGSTVGLYWDVVSNPGGATTSRVATLTVNCPFILSQPTAAFGPAGGASNVIASGAVGCFWSVTNVPPWVTLTSSETNFDGTGMISFDVVPYTGTVLRKATLRIAGESYTILQSPPDGSRPTVAITSPASGAKTLFPVVTVKGVAGDNVGVARVDVQLGSDPFVEAGRSNSWQIALLLNPGTNWIRARSTDVVGNETLSAARPVFYAVTTPLSLGTAGSGVVKGATNQQRLEIGRNYVLTAVPAAGYLFSNWTSTTTSGELPISASSALRINMQTGLVLTANFVANPFIPVKGVYNGLFYSHSPGAVHHTNSGSFTLTTTDKGTYSASIRVGGKTYPATGTFDLDGYASNVVKRTGLAPLQIFWALNLQGSDTVIGSVYATNWSEPALLDGDRPRFNSRTNPAPYLGRYTLLLPGADDDAARPHGDGFGTLTVDGNGLAKFAGTLGDGTKVSQSVALSKNGAWPLYASLYATRGSVLSWIAFNLDGSYDDLHGQLSWVRPPIPTSKSFSLGFETDTALTGSIYRAPVGATNRILHLTNGLVSLSGGNLAPPSTNSVRLGLSSIVTNNSLNTLTVKFTLTSGLFTGTFTQAGTTRKISFLGAVHQKSNRGSGYYLGTNETGRVTFEPEPEAPSP